MIELRAINFFKEDNKATIVTTKYNLHDDYEGEDGHTYILYKFENLTQKEMDDIARELRKNDIPFITLPISGTWTIQVKENEIDNCTINPPKYLELSKEELLILLAEKDKKIQELQYDIEFVTQFYRTDI